VIDFKSDVVNLPTDEMWQAMRSAEPGWIIDRDDHYVQRLEEMGAALMGKEAALFVLTGRMANLIALMTLAERGHQVILERTCHIAWSEEWGISHICGLYPRLLESDAGAISPQSVEAAILENQFHHTPVTDLVCIENTHNVAGGTVISVAQTQAVCEVAHTHGAAVFIDGARIFHAALALGVKASDLAVPADAVMFSLVKGLSAPAGALLCGTHAFVERAYDNLRRIGAWSFHKAGILAAAGIVALEKMISRLREDQLRARCFAEGLAGIPGICVDLDRVQTNIVMADLSSSGLSTDEFLDRLVERGIRAHRLTDCVARFTFHRHISDEDVETTLQSIAKVVARSGG